MSSFTLHEIFQDGMVLQRDQQIVLFGNAQTTGYLKASLYNAQGEALASGCAQAAPGGAFRIVLPQQSAAEGCTLTVSLYEESVTLHDVAIGDVWLAGGQSNMEFFLKYDRDYAQVQDLPLNPHIRMYNVPQRSFEGHNTRNQFGYNKWLKMHEDGFEKFSAIGFAFAHKIQPQVDVPIGIIGCNWGGSTASTWVPEEVLSGDLKRYFDAYDREVDGKDPEEIRRQSMEGWAWEDSDENYAHFEPLLYGRDWDWQLDYVAHPIKSTSIPMGPYNTNRPSGLYHTMLQPLTSYPIKGVIWYQGESDAGELANTYDQLMRGLIEDWRREWGIDFPFLMVELAPFGKWLECTNEGYLEVRRQQRKVADEMQAVYLASIMDLGAYYDIHPKEKLEVGRRLALLALGHVYDIDTACEAPRVSRAELAHDQIRITFDHAQSLTVTTQENDFVVRGGDTELAITEVRAEGAALYLTLNEAPAAGAQITVSLGWDDYAVIHIHNEAGLCVAPFCVAVSR